MDWLFEPLLFLLPFGAWWLWRRANPTAEPSGPVLGLAAAGVVLMLGGAVIYGFSRAQDRHAVYVPPRLGPDGEIIPGHVVPAR
ncbi:hypothetical protein C8P66_12666 [Humitalea rosea]|uniref:Uncharacterized protein n=1 Tax=Humitalea rosea TaxID=990373 RepID=A0A2W7HZA9_9PROT|nr:hypothetical protein [Humitalea rosea]PZW40021.1 hypothetical protein C8P66_12666 [Humitalea rosea]